MPPRAVLDRVLPAIDGQFHNEVAFEPDFVNAFTGEFVFLRLDFPSRTAQPAALKEQNAQLRERYAVTTYPSLLILSASGVLLEIKIAIMSS